MHAMTPLTKDTYLIRTGLAEGVSLLEVTTVLVFVYKYEYEMVIGICVYMHPVFNDNCWVGNHQISQYD